VNTASQLFDLLAETAVTIGASDIHLSAEPHPYFRVDGVLKPHFEHTLPAGVVPELAMALMSNGQRAVYEKQQTLDFAYTSSGGIRFRMNVYRERGRTSLAIRRLDDTFHSLEELGLPDQFSNLAKLKDGLVLVTGPTGSGKSTSLAALLQQINATRMCHIITIEDPVEHLHTNQRALVSQRELYTDTPSFAEAVRSALREDPDVILVGEMRDLETIRAAITAAETGHAVYSTLHTNDCVGSIDRMISVFPPAEQNYIREQMSRVLRAVVSQRLLPHAQGSGRVAAMEIMMINHAISNLIRTGDLQQIQSVMQTSAADGSVVLEQSLADLVVEKRITLATAREWLREPSVFQARLQQSMPAAV
jgi:twitching motility protein PilT